MTFREFVREEIWIVWLLAVAVVVTIGLHAVGSYFEARAFERVTGRQVSTWDAFWLDLRVTAYQAERD